MYIHDPWDHTCICQQGHNVINLGKGHLDNAIDEI